MKQKRSSGGHRGIRKHAAGVMEGVVTANRAGFGFVRVQGQDESVFLPTRQMSGVTTGDRLRVRVEKDSTGRFSGKVEAILARGVTSFLGTVEIEKRTVYVHSVDRRLSLRCYVPPAKLSGATHGQWVIARITRYPDATGGATAEIIKKLDPACPLEMAYESAIARSSLPVEFGAEALLEAESFGDHIDSKEAEGRVDLRAMPLVTIDGDDARDFDDAVYAEVHPKGFRLIVAIADVSHYVRLGTALDIEARERGTSVYFPNRVLPMLPTVLSNQLCSLEPNVDRLCFAADMVIGKTGKLLETRFYPAVMRSHARLTYTRAFAALFEASKEAQLSLGLLLSQLTPLVSLYRVLLAARNRRGALDFESSEPVFEFDNQQHVSGIKLYARNDAHKLIEECMILANVAAAQALQAAKIGGLFRVHGVPEGKKLDNLLSALASLGIAAELPEEVTPRDLKRIAERMRKSLDLPFVESLVVRSMQQAVYQPINIHHFGLALGEYAHFTSPIRRYPDLVVHRSLKAALSLNDASGVRYSMSQLTDLGQDLSKLEKRADDADRYVDTFLKCTFLLERIGQTFEGLVTTVVDFGCFVQLRGFGVDGLLHLDALRDDEYILEAGGHAWLGKRSKRRFAIGASLRVIVTHVNPVEGLIDLELAL